QPVDRFSYFHLSGTCSSSEHRTGTVTSECPAPRVVRRPVKSSSSLNPTPTSTATSVNRLASVPSLDNVALVDCPLPDRSLPNIVLPPQTQAFSRTFSHASGSCCLRAESVR